MNYNETLDNYEKTLNTLKEQCADAEKNAIIAETNLKSLEERKKQLIEECEKVTGQPIDAIPKLLAEKQQVLDDIMAQLSCVNLHEDITEDMLASLKAIADRFDLK